MNAPAAIGLDIGGTKIAAGLVDLSTGRLHSRLLRPTLPARGGPALLQDVFELLEELLAAGSRHGISPRCAGLGVPELVDLQGRLCSNATLPWASTEVLDRLQTLLPACFLADVRCAALAEARFGAGREYAASSFLYLTLGTGISCCLVVEGRPHAGARGLSGTPASSPQLFPTQEGLLSTSLPLEDFSSGPALARRYRRLQPGFEGDAVDVCRRAAAGDAATLDLVREAGRAAGAAIAHLVNVLDPGAVLLGGGLGLATGAYRTALEEGVRAHLYSPFLEAVPIRSAATGADAGVIGAAVAAAECLS